MADDQPITSTGKRHQRSLFDINFLDFKDDFYFASGSEYVLSCSEDSTDLDDGYLYRPASVKGN